MNLEEFLQHDNWLIDRAGPLYMQLRNRLECGIQTGLLTPNSPLPPERDLAALTKLSRVTVRKAIQELVRKGLVVQRQGSGSFVREAMERVEQSLSHLTSFTEDMRRRGLETTSTWLDRGVFMPSPEEQLALGLAAGEMVARISRLRRANEQPMAIEHAALPLDVLPDPSEVEDSLYAALEARNQRPVRAVQKISAINLDAHNAESLGVPEGVAGLKIQRVAYHETGRVTEFTQSIYRGDAYDFVAELRLSAPDNKTSLTHRDQGPRGTK